MSQDKNILFIAHHNNDFDHFLPLIIHLNKDKKIHSKILAFYDRNDILKNKLHNYICRINNIHLDTMIDLCFFKWINVALAKIYKHLLENTVPSKTTILNIFYQIFLRYFVMCSIFLLSDKKMKKYFKEKRIDLAVIDERSIDESLIDTNIFIRFKNTITEKTDPMNHVLFRCAKKARECNIPILMMPHGPQPVSINIVETKMHKMILNMKHPFKPDYLICCSKNDVKVHHLSNMGGIKDTSFLGDPRFDINWIKYLEKCALKVYGQKIKKPQNKIVLLYLMDIYVYDHNDNYRYKLELHKDVLSLVNHFPNLEVWVKHHPRKVFEIPINDFISQDRQKNIRQFGNDTDTNILLANADICVALNSTTFISPIVQKKPVIFYDRGKEKLKDTTTIFDGLKFKASSKEDLISQFKKIINNGYSIDDSFLLSLYKNVFSVDSLSESMIEKYMEKINEILREKNSIS